MDRLLDDPRVDIPAALVLDAGVIRDVGPAVVEANTASGAGIYGCDPRDVLEVLRAATIINSSILRSGTMPWRVVEKKIGRAGGLQQRTARQREWDGQYGEDNWEVGYVIDGEFVPQNEALESIYYRSYEEHFAAHPEDLEELAPHRQEAAEPARRGDDGRRPPGPGDHELPGAARVDATGRGGRRYRLVGGAGLAPDQHPAQPADHPGHGRAEADAGAVLAAEEVPGRLG